MQTAFLMERSEKMDPHVERTPCSQIFMQNFLAVPERMLGSLWHCFLVVVPFVLVHLILAFFFSEIVSFFTGQDHCILQSYKYVIVWNVYNTLHRMSSYNVITKALPSFTSCIKSCLPVCSQLDNGSCRSLTDVVLRKIMEYFGRVLMNHLGS